jgi:hypothetical protein
MGRWGVKVGSRGGGGDEVRGPSWRGRIKGVEGWRGFNLCVRVRGGNVGSAVRKHFCPVKFLTTLPVRHVTGNDKDYLRKIPRVVW